jgi:hypothetical protein
MYTVASGCFILSRALEKINFHHEELYVKRRLVEEMSNGSVHGFMNAEIVWRNE